MSPVAAVMDLIPSDAQALADAETRTALAFVEANKIDVTDHTSLELAVLVREEIGKAKKGIVEKLAKPKGDAYSLWKWFCGVENAAQAPYDQLDAYERDQIRAYNDAETQKRQAEERRLAEEQRKEAEERAAVEAAALEQAGEREMAAAVIEEQIAAPAPYVALHNPIKAVVSFRRVWKWKYSGGPADVKRTPPEVLERAMQLIPRSHLAPDEQKIGAYVRAMKGSSALPGITAYFVDEPIR
jgi:hypothetical protein